MRVLRRLHALVGATFVAAGAVLAAVSGTALPASASGGSITYQTGSSTTFTIGLSGSFAVKATSSSGEFVDYQPVDSLPDGLTFSDNGDGTATISGTPASDAQTTTFHIDAFDADEPDAIGAITVDIQGSPTITSADQTYFTAGQFGSFTVTTSGTPAATLSLDPQQGELPQGINLTNNGNGTARISGTSASNATGPTTVVIDASNGVGSAQPQAFTLYLDQQAAFAGGTNATFTVGTAGSFPLVASGYPAAVWGQYNGTIPGGLSVNDSGSISGTPILGAGGTYTVGVFANNDPPGQVTRADDVEASINVTVDEAPSFTSPTTTTFPAGSSQAFAFTTFGFPFPTLSVASGSLPAGVTFTSNGDGTATLLGKVDSPGSYQFTVSATNIIGSAQSQNFTLVVPGSPQITSATGTSFVTGSAGSFTVTTAASPVAALTEVGALPSGVSFQDNADGTATLAGTATSGSADTYPITITADNGSGHPTSQSFILTIDQPASIIGVSGSSEYPNGSMVAVDVTGAGVPSPLVTVAGALPAGISFSNGVLGGVTAAAGDYPLVFSASNGVGSAATQSFTLVIDAPQSSGSGNGGGGGPSDSGGGGSNPSPSIPPAVSGGPSITPSLTSGVGSSNNQGSGGGSSTVPVGVSATGPSSAGLTAKLTYTFTFAAKSGQGNPTGKVVASIPGPFANQKVKVTKVVKGKRISSIVTKQVATAKPVGSGPLVTRNGAVTKNVGKKLVVTKTSATTATVVIPASALGLGSHTITFTYGGNSHYSSATTRKAVAIVAG